MKISQLIRLKHQYDFGHDWYVQFLNINGWSLIQLSMSWNDFPSFPYIQIKSGSGDLLCIFLWVYKFGFDVNLIGKTWRWNHEQETELV